MAAAEIASARRGEPLLNLADPSVADGCDARDRQSDAPPACARPRDRQLPGRPLRRGRPPGRDRPARVDASGPARTSRLAGLRHGTELATDLRVHPRSARPAPRSGSARCRGRREHEHARGHGPVRRRRARDLGLPQRRLARVEPGGRARPQAATRGGSSRPAATGCRSPRRRASAGSASVTSPTSSMPIAHVGMLSDWVLYRLTGRFVTDPVVRFELRPVRPCQPDLVARAARSRRSASRRSCLRSSSPAPWSGALTDRAADETGLAAGTPVVVGGADTQLGLVGIGVVTPDRLTLVGGSFWQITAVTDRPLIDPQARVRTLCHAVPGQWMTEGIGFYCGIAMRWYPRCVLRAEVAEAAARGRRPLRRSWRRPRPPFPPGSNGVVADLLERDGRRNAGSRRPRRSSASTSTARGLEPAGVHPRARGAGRLRVARPPGDHRGADRRSHDEIVFTGGAAKGRLWPQIVADVLGVAVRVPGSRNRRRSAPPSTRASAWASTTTWTRWSRGSSASSGPSTPDPADRDAYDEHFDRWRSSIRGMLDLSEAGLLRPMWWPAGA